MDVMQLSETKCKIKIWKIGIFWKCTAKIGKFNESKWSSEVDDKCGVGKEQICEVLEKFESKLGNRKLRLTYLKVPSQTREW